MKRLQIYRTDQRRVLAQQLRAERLAHAGTHISSPGTIVDPDIAVNVVPHPIVQVGLEDTARELNLLDAAQVVLLLGHVFRRLERLQEARRHAENGHFVLGGESPECTRARVERRAVVQDSGGADEQGSHLMVPHHVLERERARR